MIKETKKKCVTCGKGEYKKIAGVKKLLAFDCECPEVHAIYEALRLMYAPKPKEIAGA